MIPYNGSGGANYSPQGTFSGAIPDQGDGFDPESVQSEGFGLRLLAKLASRWGVDCTDRGCKVWFEVDRRSGRFRRAA